jgi:hypothetical protein
MWAGEVREMAREKQIKLLEVWNLTMMANGFGETGDRAFRSRDEVALVETMMIINWHSRLETS